MGNAKLARKRRNAAGGLDGELHRLLGGGGRCHDAWRSGWGARSSSPPWGEVGGEGRKSFGVILPSVSATIRWIKSHDGACLPLRKREIVASETPSRSAKAAFVSPASFR